MEEIFIIAFWYDGYFAAPPAVSEERVITNYNT